ncbi:MAG: alpha amylase C-terminal domain-containing protein, partial [Nitrososphaerota archaeon]|nr:alpha amylase C-terminal domain-containing protein [Nitrososphaerota archaeon]
ITNRRGANNTIEAKPGYYEELLNSDAKEYGGSGMGNYGGKKSDAIPYHGRPYSIALTLPPLSVDIFEYKVNS